MKRFLKKLSVFCIPLLVLVACYIYVMANISGDLGELGMIPFGKYEVGETPDFVEYYDSFSIEEAQNAEIVVLGDSFTKKNINSYMNYLGHELGKKVCHLYINDNKMSPCAAANILIDNDLLPNCKVLVLESVERYSISWLMSCFKAKKLVFSEKSDDAKTRFNLSKYLNLKTLSSFVKLSLNVDNPVGKLQLDGDYFTNKYADKLYFYASESDGGGDLWYEKFNEKYFAQAKSNLLTLRQKAAEKGIDFYYLMAADKFDMYYDKIVDNPYPANPIFDYFSDVDTSWYVAGKQILTPALRDGVKDIYLVNDTHWSRIAAEIVGRHLARLIKLKHCQER